MSRKARQRTSRLPIRMQLMLPIAAALMGMLVLGLFQTVHVWDGYQDATDAEVIGDLAGSLASTLDGHQSEGAPLLEAVLIGEADEIDIGALRARTDASVVELVAAAETSRARFPVLENSLDELLRQVAKLNTARTGLDGLASGELTFTDNEVVGAFEIYRDMANKIVSLAARLPNLVDDSQVSSQIDSLASAMQAGRLASEIQFRVTSDLTLLAAEEAVLVEREALAEAAYLSGSYDRQIIDFQANASAEVSDTYQREIQGEEAIVARQALSIYLNGDIPTLSATDFSAAQGQVVQALHLTQDHALVILERDVAGLRDSSTRTLLTTFALILVLAMTAIISAAMLARRISLRVDSVREATLTAAYDTLPKTVAAVSQASNADEVDRLLQTAKRQTVIATDARYSDELDSLAEAFSAAHHQALRQTANQALLRIDVEAMMKTLARRGQSLIRRQQQVMESLVEESRSASDIPEEWRSVYHLLSRMRRNEENLLLLAGGEPQRRYNHPADVEAIIRDAVSEIEGAGRVLVENQVSARLETKPAGDVVRILAELLDNAAAYSPPTQQVRVTSRRSGSEIVISIADDGIGLNPEQMSAINRRLAEPTQLNSELTATMGLLVVGRLAAEHAVSVQLHSTMGKGTLALVRIPASAHADMPNGLVSSRGSSARLALSAHAANLPMTGTGSPAAAEGAAEPIVPKPRKAGLTPEPRPVAGKTVGSVRIAEGIEVTASPGAESVDVTFRKVNRALESAGGPNGTELPRRAPGTKLLPGAVPGAKPGSGGVDLDPAEIRDRLTGFASGIAAASEHEQR
ncbi:ATP-binding protein [Glycomyces sp. L485]|uniref:sensor histidine kinase n=1 Tax=Glycomyces sp. L485 TaxID=2909235 RepID=UPI001F4A539E|nr:ATP-binding protein [Glycomyces sp. L485]MCH7232611.1 ATP-binding protein [Glycomyces sp. L485]